jgi:outer membrane protein assembly factor BamB
MSTHSTDFSETPLPPPPPADAPGKPAPGKRARRPRWWLPAAFLVLGGAGLAVAWVVPLGDVEEVNRTMTIYAILVLTLLLTLGWLLLTRATRLATLITLVAVAGGAAAAIDGFKFTGDMWILFHFRWQPHHADLLEEHRQRQPRRDLPPVNVTVAPTDNPEYRGRHRDGTVVGPRLATGWQAKPPRQVWEQPCGGGYSSFAIAGNVAVTLEQRRDDEAVVCYDLETGHERWIHKYPAKFSEAMGGEGPRSTPTIADEDVYALGATGLLHCLDVRTGAVRWQVNTLEGNANVMWGLAGSPLVYKNVVLVNPGVQQEGAPRGTLVAYDRATGTPVWSAGKAHAGYSSPMLAKLGGREQVVLFDGEGVAGYDPEDGGKELWRYPWQTNQNINVAQPLVVGPDRILISSGYTVGCAVLEVKEKDGQWTATPAWPKAKQQSLRCRFTSPVLWEGHAYGLDEGVLVCVDVATGARRWREGRYGHGQVLVTNGVLLILGEKGELALVEASPQGHKELGRIQALEWEPGGRTWNVPALVNGRAYVRNDSRMACYDLNP